MTPVYFIRILLWIDQRNREQEQKTFEAFHHMVCQASGQNESGQTISMVQQVASIYQLQKYKQYDFAAIPVLELMQFEFKDKQKDERSEYLDKAIDYTLQVLKQ